MNINIKTAAAMVVGIVWCCAVTAAPQLTVGNINAWPLNLPTGKHETLPVNLASDVTTAGIQFEINFLDPTLLRGIQNKNKHPQPNLASRVNIIVRIVFLRRPVETRKIHRS